MPFDKVGQTARSPSFSQAACLQAVYRRVREALVRARGSLSTRKRRSADACRLFEMQAFGEVIDALTRQFDSGVIISRHSSGPVVYGLDPPSRRFIVELDGIDNFLRGLPMATISIAMGSPDTTLSLQAAETSLVGLLDEDCSWYAVRGHGAWHRGRRLRAPVTKSTGGAFVSWRRTQGLETLLDDEGVAELRDFGCTVAPIAMIASGSLDAHIDLSGDVPRECVLAVAHILHEAGGALWVSPGVALAELEPLPARVCLLAFASRQLANAASRVLARDDDVVAAANGPHDSGPCGAVRPAGMVIAR